MIDLLLIGGGGHCKSCIDIIEDENKFNIFGILDNNLEIGSNVLGYKVIGSDNDLKNSKKLANHAFITIGQIKTSQTRREAFSHLQELGFIIPAIISKSSNVSEYCSISIGTIVMHSATVQASARVGENCILNNHCLVEHDASIGSNCHISTNAIINGGVVIKENTFIGSGAIIKEGISIGKNVIVGAGSLILKDIEDNQIITGVHR